MDPQPEENTPINGEIVEQTPWLWDEPRERRGDRYDEDTIAEAIRARAMGFTLVQIANRVGCHFETVRRWCGEHEKSRHYADADVIQVRAAMAVELETASHEAWRLVREYPGTELALKALSQLNHLVRTRMTLLGAAVPARVHVDIKETTQTDLELQEMIREAQAKAWTDADRIKAGFEQRNGPPVKPKANRGGPRPGPLGKSEVNPPEPS
jgi:transposase-like protein